MSQEFRHFKNYLDNQSTNKSYEFEKQFSSGYQRPIQLVQNQEVKSIIKKQLVLIDSRDRDEAEDPWDFRVNISNGSKITETVYNENTLSNETRIVEPTIGASLQEPSSIRNVVKVSLDECILPNFSNIYPYLVLHIPELQEFHLGTNDLLRKAFAVLVPLREHGNNWLTCKTANSLGLISSRTYNPPLAKLTSLSIKLFTPDGDPFTWVPFPPNPITSPLPNWHLSLNISYLEPHRNFAFKSVPIF